MNELIHLIPDCEGLKLIFVETRKDADTVEKELIHEGLDAISIHGDRTQAEREHALKMFRNNKISILVATDVAARGLDIPNVMYVINYDLPNNIDSYVHRIGRTGRCGNNGNSISFVNDNNKPILKDLLTLLQETKQDIPQWFSSLVSQSNGSYYYNHHYNNNNNSNNNYYHNKQQHKSYNNGNYNHGSFASRDYRHNNNDYNHKISPNSNNHHSNNSNTNFASKREFISSSKDNKEPTKSHNDFNDKEMLDSW